MLASPATSRPDTMWRVSKTKEIRDKHNWRCKYQQKEAFVRAMSNVWLRNRFFMVRWTEYTLIDDKMHLWIFCLHLSRPFLNKVKNTLSSICMHWIASQHDPGRKWPLRAHPVGLYLNICKTKHLAVHLRRDYRTTPLPRWLSTESN